MFPDPVKMTPGSSGDILEHAASEAVAAVSHAGAASLVQIVLLDLSESYPKF